MTVDDKSDVRNNPDPVMELAGPEKEMSTLDSKTSSHLNDSNVIALVPAWDAGEEIRILPSEGDLIVGSDITADIRVRLPDVAPRHCRISSSSGSSHLNPLDGNTVILNRHPVNGIQPIRAGDVVRIGMAEFRLESRRQRSSRRFRRQSSDQHTQSPSPSPSASQPTAKANSPASIADIPASPLASSRPATTERPRSVSSTELNRFTATSDEQRRDVLDARESRLIELQEQLEERSVELDLRADRLTLQQTQLLTRQRQLEKRRAALEERRATEFQEWSQQEDELRRTSTAELTDAKAAVERLTDALNVQQQEHEEKKQALLDVTDRLEDKQRELVALRQQLEVVTSEQETRHSSTQEDVERLTQRLETVQQEHDADREQWRRKTAELTTSLTALSQQENGLEGARQAFEATKLEHLKRIQDARLEIAAREAALKEQLEKADAQRSIDQQSAQELADWKAEVEAERARLADERAAQEAELAGVRDELRSLESDLAERELAVQESEQQKQVREEELAAREVELQSFSAELAESSRAVEEQSEKLRALQEQLDQQATDQKAERTEAQSQQDEIAAELKQRAERLAEWESELNARHDDLGQQVQRLKQEVTDEQASLSVAETHRFAEELEQERRRNELLTKERDELSTALGELRSAFESIREELVERNEKDADLASEVKALREALEDKQNQLQETATALEEQRKESEEFRQQLRELTARFETEQQELREQLEASQLQQPPEQQGSEQVDELLQEVETLREELSESRNAEPSEGVLSQLGEYEDQIAELQRQLAEATNDEPAFERADTVNVEHLQIIAELKDRIEQLQREVSEAQAARSENLTTTEPEIQIRERELDDRTILLDNREEEIRERQRMMEHSENEIEQQRRDLLEARQQLEMARAEIQVAMDNAASSPAEAQTEPFHAPEPDPITDDEVEEETSTPSVRSEIAELFGLGSADSLQVPANEESEERPSVDDYSQESSAEVSMSFDASEQLLLEPESQDAEPESADSGESSEDSLISDYMEQLLARNRKGAGESLPKELKKEDSKPAEKEEPKSSPPAQKSFIEAYMSGQYGETGEDTSAPAMNAAPADVVPDETSGEPDHAAPARPRIDLEALRHDMDSFRQLSTKSVENALATHAKRQERGGLAARTTICTVLILGCVFVVAAAAMEVIPFGIFVWLSIIVAIGASAELGLKIWGIKKKVQQKSELVSGEKAAPHTLTEQLSAEAAVEGQQNAPLPHAGDQVLPESLSESDLIVDAAEPVAAEHTLPLPADVAVDGPVSDSPGDPELQFEEIASGDIVESALVNESAPPSVSELPSTDAIVDQVMNQPTPAPESNVVPPTGVDSEANSSSPMKEAPPSQDSGASMGRSQIEELLAEITGGDPTK